MDLEACLVSVVDDEVGQLHGLLLPLLVPVIGLITEA